MTPAPPAAFLDRDGVLVDEVGYLTRVDRLKLLPGAAEGISGLRRRGFLPVVVTNQSAVARGLLSLAELDAIHAALRARLAEAGAPLEGIYFCPHHPAGAVAEWRRDCECRKPKAGLLRQAAAELGVALNRDSILVGDQWRDLECAEAAGVTPILVRSGRGAEIEDRVRRERPEIPICDSIAAVPEAVDHLKAGSLQGGGRP